MTPPSSAVREAQHCMRHRGPDENEAWWDDRAVFGFNRLSFIDIEHSHQPMPYADGRYRIVFNGEIYNYLELRAELAAAGATFATEGDTEAIVAGYHLWGEDVVDRLRGMFAFVIWDTQTQTVFGARDPFGIKPLFTTRLADGGIVFCSEKKALLELLGGSKAAGGVDAASLQHYLTLQYVPEPATLHRGIRRIESGTSFTVVDGELHTKRYFHPTFPIRPVAKDEEQALYDRIADVLDDSVRMHMRADVTVGSFLSGGIDSTAIAALAKRYNPNLLTFTTGFEREGFSEIDVAAESAAAIGVEHITKVVTAGGVRRRHPAGGLVPRRPGRRPGARAAVLHRPRGPQAREGRALRRGRRRAVRRLQHLPRAAVAGGVREAAVRRPPGAGQAVDQAARRHARQGPAAPRLDPAGAAVLRQRPDLPRRRAGLPRAPRPRPVARGGHRRAVPAHPGRPATTTSPPCSTSTCSPGCAATSWSRPTR